MWGETAATGANLFKAVEGLTQNVRSQYLQSLYPNATQANLNTVLGQEMQGYDQAFQAAQARAGNNPVGSFSYTIPAPTAAQSQLLGGQASNAATGMAPGSTQPSLGGTTPTAQQDISSALNAGYNLQPYLPATPGTATNMSTGSAYASNLAKSQADYGNILSGYNTAMASGAI